MQTSKDRHRPETACPFSVIECTVSLPRNEPAISRQNKAAKIRPRSSQFRLARHPCSHPLRHLANVRTDIQVGVGRGGYKPMRQDHLCPPHRLGFSTWIWQTLVSMIHRLLLRNDDLAVHMQCRSHSDYKNA